MSTQGYSAYKTAQKKSDDPRDVEYSLLAQVTASLLSVKDNKDLKATITAVLWNRDVWAALRMDLLDEENKLPKELRASLVSVSMWIEKETHAVMDGHGDLEALIDINRNIMAGLKPEHAYEPMPVSEALL